MFGRAMFVLFAAVLFAGPAFADPATSDVTESRDIRSQEIGNLIQVEFLLDRWFERNGGDRNPLYAEIADSLAVLAADLKNPYHGGATNIFPVDSLGVPTIPVAAEDRVGGIGIGCYPCVTWIFSYDRAATALWYTRIGW